ncbi:hypothetical protein LTR12_009501 [Friedmanniomyces endolithicus]|nr:hypothetical protein LTR12_009501 [Friedmanniomyces endolithicus]
MPSTKRPPTTSPPPPPPKRQPPPLPPSKWKHHPSSPNALLNLCLLRAKTRHRLGTNVASYEFRESEWAAITSLLNTKFTTRFEWTQCRSKFLELRGLWKVWLALHKRVVDKRAPNTWKGGRRIRGRWVSRVGDMPRITVELEEAYFGAFDGVEEVGLDRMRMQYGRLVKLFGEDLGFGQYACFADELSSEGSEGEDGGDLEEMGSSEEGSEDEGEDEIEDEIEDGLEDASENPATARSTSSSPAESRGRRLHRDGGTRKSQGAARLGAADSPVRTASSSLSRPRNAVAARSEAKACEQIKKLTAALRDGTYVQSESTIMRQLSPDDRIDLFETVAQAVNAVIILTLPHIHCVEYVEVLVQQVKQSRQAPEYPRIPGLSRIQSSRIASAALARCNQLAFVRELPHADREMLLTAVIQRPNSEVIVALEDNELLVPYVESLLREAKQAVAAKISTIAGPPTVLSGGSTASAPGPMPLYHPHLQPPPQQQYQPHPNGVNYGKHHHLRWYLGHRRTNSPARRQHIICTSSNSPLAAIVIARSRKRQNVTHLASSTSACASADVRARQEVRPCHSPEAVAAQDQESTNNTVHELPTAVKDPASDPRTTAVSAALARCDMLSAVRGLSPEDRVKLYTVVAQPPMSDLIVALPDQNLAPYVETLVGWAKQAPQEAILPPASGGGGSKSDLSGTARVTITRCSSLAAVRALSRLDHVLLITAVEQPPHSGLVVAFSDTDLMEYIKALLVSLQQAPAARETFAGGPPRLLKSVSAVTATAEVAAAVHAAAIAPIPGGHAGVYAAALPGVSAMSRGERPAPSLLGYGWTAQPWAEELTEYLWGRFRKDIERGIAGTGSLSAPAVEAGAVSCRAA